MVAANLYYTRIHILRDFTASYFILIHCNFALSNSYSKFHCLNKKKILQKRRFQIDFYIHTIVKNRIESWVKTFKVGNQSIYLVFYLVILNIISNSHISKLELQSTNFFIFTENLSKQLVLAGC